VRARKSTRERTGGVATGSEPEHEDAAIVAAIRAAPRPHWGYAVTWAVAAGAAQLLGFSYLEDLGIALVVSAAAMLVVVPCVGRVRSWAHDRRQRNADPWG
jgi:hypothetical protein